MKTRAVSAFAAAVIALFVSPVLACSLVPGYRVAKPPLTIRADENIPAPQAPRVSVSLMQRGYGVSDGAGCNDAGFLTILLEGGMPPGISGYRFRLASGSMPNNPFPDALLLPIEITPGQWGFGFVWLDLEYRSSNLKPIDAVIEVQQVAGNGIESEAAHLRIVDTGGTSTLR